MKKNRNLSTAFLAKIISFSIASFGSVRSDLGKYLCRELMSIWRLINKYLYCSYTLHPGNNS